MASHLGSPQPLCKPWTRLGPKFSHREHPPEFLGSDHIPQSLGKERSIGQTSDSGPALVTGPDSDRKD